MINYRLKKEFVTINGSDLASIHEIDAVKSRFRSIEKYLEKHNREYKITENVCTVYVNDKLDAIELGFNFRLDSIKYFDGLKSQVLNLNQKHKRASPPQYSCVCGKKLKKKEFLAIQKRSVTKDGVSKSDLIKRKVFTRSEIDKLVQEKLLNPIDFRSRIYFSMFDIRNALKPIPNPPRLF